MSNYKGHLEDANGNILLPISTDIATPQLSATATQSFAKGDYLYYNNTLYKVTSAISSGGTIQPGTNCTATTVGAELKSLNSGSGGFKPKLSTVSKISTKGTSLNYDAWVSVTAVTNSGNVGKVIIGGYEVAVADASSTVLTNVSWSGFVPKNTTISWNGVGIARACQVE